MTAPASTPAELSQEVITAPEALPAPAPVGPEWDRWERLWTLMDVAEATGYVVVPRALRDRYDQASAAQREGRPLPAMAPVKRELVRLREEVAWSLRIQGFNQIRIAHTLGISQPAVCKILRRVERRALARMEADVRAVKAKQATQLEFILDQALGAWKLSKETLGRTSSSVSQPNRYGGQSCRQNTTRRHGNGDPRFLLVALKALAAERELWGLNGPPEGHGDPTATIQATRIETLTVRGRCAGEPGSGHDPGRT
jgi:transposase